jgi:hypothetical protein
VAATKLHTINLVFIFVSSFFVNFNVFILLFGWFLWVSQVKAFLQTERNKLALFPHCILSELVRFLYLPSSVYTRIGSAEFQQSQKNFS